MKYARTALLLIGVAFLIAEIARPTRFHPKKIATRSLLLASQHGANPRPSTLGTELLDDLPRIWPNAPTGFLLMRDVTHDRAARRLRGSTVYDPGAASSARILIAGSIDDPYTGSPGVAIFPILDGTRVTNFRASYDAGRFALAVPCQPSSSAPQHLAIGLVAADQRGYFESTKVLDYAGCSVHRSDIHANRPLP